VDVNLCLKDYHTTSNLLPRSSQKVLGVDPCYEYHMSQAITISLCIKNIYQILKLQRVISNLAITFEI